MKFSLKRASKEEGEGSLVATITITLTPEINDKEGSVGAETKVSMQGVLPGEAMEAAMNALQNSLEGGCNKLLDAFEEMLEHVDKVEKDHNHKEK
jgi:hypothetical protein